MPRLTLPVFIFLLSLFFILLGQSYLKVKGRAQRLELLQDEVQALQNRKTEVEEELDYRQSPDYIEKEARELGYTKKGEVIVVLPDLEKKEKEKEVAAVGSDGALSSSDKEAPIWQRWGCLWISSSWSCP
jgi:cell division protein FtsB